MCHTEEADALSHGAKYALGPGFRNTKGEKLAEVERAVGWMWPQDSKVSQQITGLWGHCNGALYPAPTFQEQKQWNTASFLPSKWRTKFL